MTDQSNGEPAERRWPTINARGLMETPINTTGLSEAAGLRETPIARPFQLHQEGGRILHGAQFPSGHVALEADDTCIYRMSLGHLLETYPGVAIWPEDLARLENDWREGKTDAELHARCAHPDFEYRTTEGARKQFDASVPPADDNGDPDPTWEVNTDAGRDGWERFDYTEEAYWRRRKQQP